MILTTYKSGKIDGYEEGYKDAVLELAEYLKENSFLCDPDVDWHSFQAIDVDDLDRLVDEFLRGKDI